MKGKNFLRPACGESIYAIDSDVVTFQELDLLWSLRLFVKGGAWRIARDIDVGSAFPGFAEFSKRMEPFANRLEEDDEDDYDNLGEFLDRLYKKKLISYEEANSVPREFLCALREEEKHFGKGEALFSPLKENVELFSKTFGFSQVEKALFTFIVLTQCCTTLLNHYVRWFDCSHNISLIASIFSCATEIPEHEIYDLLTEKKGNLFQVLDLDLDDNNSDIEDFFRCKRGLNFFSITSTKLAKKDIEALFFSEAPTSELSLNDYQHIPEIGETLLPYLRYALAHAKAGVNVLLYGAPGTGKTQLTRALGQVLSTPVFEIVNHTVKEERNSRESVDRLHAWEIANSFVDEKSPALFVLDESEDIFLAGLNFYNGAPIRENKAEINHLLESNIHPTLWLTNSLRGMDSAMLRRFDLVIEVTQPTVEQRLAIIDKCVGELLSEDMKGRLARTENLSPGVISRTVSVLKALEKPSQEERDKKMLTLINSVLEVQNAGIVAPKLAPVDTVYDTTFVHTDVDLAGIARGMKAHASARLCLYGPPGTGKTAYAQWLAKYLKKSLIQKKSSDILSKWVGGTEANIAKAFEQAKRENAILLIDEADSFLQDRSKSSHSWETTQVNEMLTQMESFEGIFIATTNLVETLDAASLRRFDLKAKFDYLSEDQALALYARWIKELNIAEDAQSEETIRALSVLTPGDFASVVRQSKFNPIFSSEDFAKRLAAECELKSAYSGKRKAIGFC